MEQQNNDLALNDFASVANTEVALDNVSHSVPLQLEVQVVDFVSNYAVRGLLEGFTPGEVTILLNEPISEQRMVSVRLNSFAFEGQTLYCRPRQNQFEAHISIDDVEANGLRIAPRFPVNLPAQLFLSQTEPISITIIDISSAGLGIELPVSVEFGQPIAVASGSVFVFAIIRHCRQLSEGMFRAGAEMHHLLQKEIDVTTDTPRSNFLQKVLRKRSPKGADLTLAWR